MADAPVPQSARPYQVKQYVESGYATQAALDELIAYMNEIGRVNPCPKCIGAGVIRKSVNTKSPDDENTLIQCDMVSSDSDDACDGWGYTKNQIGLVSVNVVYKKIV